MKPTLDPDLAAFTAFAAHAFALSESRDARAEALGRKLVFHAAELSAKGTHLGDILAGIEQRETAMQAEFTAKLSEAAKVWGPKKWQELHTLCRELDASGVTDPTVIKQRLEDFIKTIPCPRCRAHFMRFRRKSPERPGQMFAWSVEVHDAVNASLRPDNPPFGLAAASALYP
jgi:hypothetical protein